MPTRKRSSISENSGHFTAHQALDEKFHADVVELYRFDIDEDPN